MRKKKNELDAPLTRGTKSGPTAELGCRHGWCCRDEAEEKSNPAAEKEKNRRRKRAPWPETRAAGRIAQPGGGGISSREHSRGGGVKNRRRTGLRPAAVKRTEQAPKSDRGWKIEAGCHEKTRARTWPRIRRTGGKSWDRRGERNENRQQEIRTETESAWPRRTPDGQNRATSTLESEGAQIQHTGEKRTDQIRCKTDIFIEIQTIFTSKNTEIINHNLKITYKN
jgi:hypothetical protein